MTADACSCCWLLPTRPDGGSLIFREATERRKFCQNQHTPKLLCGVLRSFDPGDMCTTTQLNQLQTSHVKGGMATPACLISATHGNDLYGQKAEPGYVFDAVIKGIRESVKPALKKKVRKSHSFSDTCTHRATVIPLLRQRGPNPSRQVVLPGRPGFAIVPVCLAYPACIVEGSTPPLDRHQQSAEPFPLTL